MNEHGESSPARSSPSDAAARPICRQCFEFLDAGDNFCRHCGDLTEHGETVVTIGKQPTSGTRAFAAKPPGWSESPVFVGLALFVFLGPLGLPLLWGSRRFTRAWKIGLTVVVLLATVAIVWYACAVVNTWQRQLNDALQMTH